MVGVGFYVVGLEFEVVGEVLVSVQCLVVLVVIEDIGVVQVQVVVVCYQFDCVVIVGWFDVGYGVGIVWVGFIGEYLVGYCILVVVGVVWFVFMGNGGLQGFVLY